MYDIIIINGTILDGTGRKMFTSDIGIKNGVIRKMEYLRHEPAHQILDAGGCFVTPGFIDITNHSDTYWQLFAENGLESLIQQGITTIIGGNSGSSLAPFVDRNMLQTIQKWVDIGGLNLNWLSMMEFLDEIEKRHLPINFGTLVGHTTLRRGVLGDANRPITSDEIKILQKMLHQSLNEGALGVSFGLPYAHAREAESSELMALLEIIKSAKGMCAIQLRNESDESIQSIEEAIFLAKSTGVRMHISHLKILNEKNWPLLQKALHLMETAVSEGVNISFDVYPYTSTASVLYTLLPDWVTNGGKKAMLIRLKDKKLRQEVIQELSKNPLNYAKVTLLSSSINSMTCQQNIAAMAKKQQKTPEEILIDVLVASNGRAIISLEALSEKNIEREIQHSLACVSSNGFGLSKKNREIGEVTHPRNFGSFPRFLGKYVRERQLLGWEEAIRKITLQPAERLGLSKRGKLASGNWADIAIFDPKRIIDMATITHPYQYPLGIRWVIVNGEVVLADGVMTGKKTGQVIRRKQLCWWR